MAEPAPDLEASSLLDSAWSEGVAGLRVMASDERLAARSRIASGALVLVLLAVSVFAVWSSQAPPHRGESGRRGQPPVRPLCGSVQRDGC